MFNPIDPQDPSQSPRRRRFKAIPVRMLVPNLITLLALCAGLTAIRLAFENKLDLALAGIVFAALLDGMAPWRGDRLLVNNLAPEEATDVVAIYGEERYARLASVKRRYDPTNMFRINHNVAPAA